MTGSRVYPDEPAGPFPSPPSEFEDGEGRTIDVQALEEDDEDQIDALVEMYDDFDAADRAQGIPPSGEKRIRDWLEPIFAGGVNVVAWHDETVAGHATLVPEIDDPDTADDYGAIEWELAIFVHQTYQRAGIGTKLLEHLLGHASDRGIDRIWLTVERWNDPAIALYERVGFETCSTESFEQEMAIRLE
ncbi:GNAT family N-acetyltransferase [Natrialbaceae archaeon AArc-T1-2]|uniref:GNAT family N-acetyltransferase n=1 Tax=Natrialbaceae archaeon AArc-T1-2 TaxID=3053904 RepID=UPI00255B0229|nr:GNAT family N-acetyltransferase [Natrialbaceae archaeon AArc-T1-2]WIV66464.1 GNAT family N-acetyltransferase [Natrialbaceae archaeon AArc-T1-2]